MKILFILVSFMFSSALSAEFGQYRYSKYLGIQQQIQTQRIMAQRRNRMYYNNPVRNIRYPSADNPYPNIQRTPYQRISPRQRYNPNYYKTHY